jgi:hypothetical protein
MDNTKEISFTQVSFFNRYNLILVFILLAFFLKGVFIITAYPIFTGQDEERHYNTVQYFAEPKDALLNVEKNLRSAGYQGNGSDSLDDYNFSEEIQKTSVAANIDIVRGSVYNTQIFSEDFNGQNESKINSRPWKPYNYYTYPDIVEGKFLYYLIPSFIEKIFSEQSILMRFHLSRLFSLLLGTLAILFTYLIAKNIGLSPKISLLMAAIVSFQPRLSIYFTTINYDALLIPLFILFTLGGVLALKNGLNWKNLIILVLSVFLAIQTKPTGNILLVPLALLLGYSLFKKLKNREKIWRYVFYAALPVTLTLLVFFFRKFIPELSLNEFYASVQKYLLESLTPGKLALSSRTYWGLLGSNNSSFLSLLQSNLNVLWIAQSIVGVGIAFLLFTKRRLDFLPEKRYLVFLVSMLVFLQLGIRFADWSVFHSVGKIYLGAPGRYFLPNIAAHIILFFIGIGALVRKKEIFDRFSVLGLISMMTVSLYTIFNVIVLKYYF